MDPQRLKDAYERLEALDQRLSHKLRPRSGGSMVRPSIEQLEEKLRDLSIYTVELREIVRDICLAFARRPEPGPTPRT